MTNQVRVELIASLLAWGTLALFCTLLAGTAWLVRLRTQRRMAANGFSFEVPGTGPEVLAAFLLYMVFEMVGHGIGVAVARPTSDRPVEASAMGTVKPAQILGDAIAFPLQLVGIPLLLFAA